MSVAATRGPIGAPLSTVGRVADPSVIKMNALWTIALFASREYLPQSREPQPIGFSKVVNQLDHGRDFLALFEVVVSTTQGRRNPRMYAVALQKFTSYPALRARLGALFPAALAYGRRRDPSMAELPMTLRNARRVRDGIEDRDAAGKTALIRAANAGRHTDALDLIGAGADINATCPNGDTALFMAALERHADTVRHLIHARADINAARRVHEVLAGTTPLFAAASVGDVIIVDLLIAARANPNAATVTQTTPLHAAAHNNYWRVAQSLIGARANVHSPNRHGTTPLHTAAVRGHAGVVADLLRAKADANVVRTVGLADRLTPLIAAAAKGHVTTVDSLLRARANPDSATRAGLTAWDVAARGKHGNVLARLPTDPLTALARRVLLAVRWVEPKP